MNRKQLFCAICVVFFIHAISCNNDDKKVIITYYFENNMQLEQAFGPDLELMIQDASNALNVLVLSKLNIALVQVSAITDADIIIGDDVTRNIDCYTVPKTYYWGTTRKAAFTKACNYRQYYIALVTYNPDFLRKVSETNGTAMVAVVATRIASIIYKHFNRSPSLIKVVGDSKYAIDRTYDLSTHDVVHARQWMHAVTFYYQQVLKEIARRPSYNIPSDFKQFWYRSLAYRNGTFYPPERMFHTDRYVFNQYPSLYNETHYASTIRRGAATLIWPIHPPYIKSRCMWLKGYPPLTTYVPVFDWHGTTWHGTDSFRIVSKVSNFTKPIIVKKLAASMSSLIPPAFLPRDGHYISMSHDVFYFGFACGGGPAYRKGYPRKYIEQSIKRARTVFAPYDPTVIHLTKERYLEQVRKAIGYFNLMWACKKEDEITFAREYDEARYVLVAQFYKGAWGDATKRPCDIRGTRMLILNMAHPYYRSRGPFPFIVRVLLSAFSGRDYCGPPITETFDDFWLTSETGTCGRVNDLVDINAYIGGIPEKGSHIRYDAARFVRYAMSSSAIPATKLVPVKKWQRDVVPWLANDINYSNVCFSLNRHMHVEIPNDPLRHAIIIPNNPTKACHWYTGDTNLPYSNEPSYFYRWLLKMDDVFAALQQTGGDCVHIKPHFVSDKEITIQVPQFRNSSITVHKLSHNKTVAVTFQGTYYRDLTSFIKQACNLTEN